MNNRMLVISLDYDACGDILYDDQFKTYFGPMLNRAKKCKEDFIAFLNKKAQGYTFVMLCVGSLRQSIGLDMQNIAENDNGSCFKVFAQFSKEKNWIFNEFLLPDAQYQKPAGTAMRNRNIKFIPFNTPLPQEEKLKIEEQKRRRIVVKTKIINEQIITIKKQYPDYDIDMIFIDDDGEEILLDGIKKHFSSVDDIGCNLQLFKFEWIPKVINNLNVEVLKCHSYFPRKTSSTSLIQSSLSLHSIPVELQVATAFEPDESVPLIESNSTAVQQLADEPQEECCASVRNYCRLG
jgi:hypothetical protein